LIFLQSILKTSSVSLKVCELHVAGYKFSVLDNAFLVHQGFKTPDSFHAEKDEDQERNRLLFRQFKTELRERYPESSRRCY
jgi:N-acetyllactosaminide beta-1,3-N-acetylglucosaminyltransferase